MTDGTNIINVNRDDASGFRLDTLATHKQYGAPTLRGSEVLTTHTDYVNRYPSVLQEQRTRQPLYHVNFSRKLYGIQHCQHRSSQAVSGVSNTNIHQVC